MDDKMQTNDKLATRISEERVNEVINRLIELGVSDVNAAKRLMWEFQVQEMIASGRLHWIEIFNRFSILQRGRASDRAAHGWEFTAIELSKDGSTERIEAKSV